MTDDALGTSTPPLVPEAHRVVRALDAVETPFGGLLVTRGEGVAVQVDAETLTGWAGWGFAGAEHIAAPLDVVRRRDGHDVLLPWCTERVTSLLVRRQVVDEHLSLGESSTLVASVLRGIDELGEPGARESGTWWVTGEGRPVFVVGEGEPACAGAARVVELVAEGCRDRGMGRVLAQVQMGLHLGEAQPRVPQRQIEEWEGALLQIAAPRPLRCDIVTPEGVQDVARAANARPRERPALGRRDSGGIASGMTRRARRAGRSRLPGGTLGAFHQGAAGLMRRFAGALPSLSDRRLSSPARAWAAGSRSRTDHDAAPRSRRRSLLIAGAAAAAVLAGGLLWPGGDSGEAAEGQSEESSGVRQEAPASPGTTIGDGSPETTGVSASPMPSATSHPGAGVPAVDEAAIVAATALLDAAAGCDDAAQSSCPEVIAEGSTADVADLAGIATAEPTISPVDEYGDVAVIRAESPDAAHILVLVRVNEKWLVRDVYDVADQPD
ncbi:hypothetical protein ACFY9N_08885 [Microbacterium sp. NPDC008134]|uniref:hypothetical protein n=1 Tax=Microbacterium sp. NPDC008134 TaxID=3364183 RepID=UPI0036EE368F